MAIIKVNARSASALDATVLTGNLPAISGASLTGVDAGLTLLSTTNFSGSASNTEISLDHSSYHNFLLICDYLEGSSSGTGENGDIIFKRAGQSSFNTGSSDYGWGGSLHDLGTAYNVNLQNTMEIFRGSQPDNEFNFVMFIVGAGNTTSYTSIHTQLNKVDLGNGQSSYNTNGVFYSTERVTDMQFSFTAGTVTKLQAKLYGYGE